MAAIIFGTNLITQGQIEQGKILKTQNSFCLAKKCSTNLENKK